MNQSPYTPPRLLTAANAITMGSLAGAFFIITEALNGSVAYLGPLFLFCVLCDGLDGYVARRTGQAGQMGVFLDSIVDVVSFGVAPLVAAACFLRGQDLHLPFWAGYLYLCCIVIRLSRFNVQEDTSYFLGLNSPSAAALVVFCLWIVSLRTDSWLDSMRYGLVVGSVVISALLMVAPCQYISSKKLPGGRGARMTVVTSLVLALAISQDLPLVLFVCALLYAMSGPAVAISRRLADALRRYPR